MQKRCFSQKPKIGPKTPSVSRDFWGPLRRLYKKWHFRRFHCFLQKVVRFFQFFTFLQFLKKAILASKTVEFWARFIFQKVTFLSFCSFCGFFGFWGGTLVSSKMWSDFLAPEGKRPKSGDRLDFTNKKGSQKWWIRRKKWHKGPKSGPKSGTLRPALKILKNLLISEEQKTAFFKFSEKVQKVQKRCFLAKAENGLKKCLLFLGIFDPWMIVYIRSGIFDVFTIFCKKWSAENCFQRFAISAFFSFFILLISEERNAIFVSRFCSFWKRQF